MSRLNISPVRPAVRRLGGDETKEKDVCKTSANRQLGEICDQLLSPTWLMARDSEECNGWLHITGTITIFPRKRDLDATLANSLKSAHRTSLFIFLSSLSNASRIGTAGGEIRFIPGFKYVGLIKRRNCPAEPLRARRPRKSL